MTPPKTRVVNVHREKFDVYIGRAGHGKDGYFGNPFKLPASASAESRAKVIEQYRDYFTHRLFTDREFYRRVLELRGKTLGCFCKPESCHGDVIVEWLEANP